MFILKYLKDQKQILEKKFQTFDDAEEQISKGPEDAETYEIYDSIKEELVDEGDIESNDEKIEGTLNMMFPNKDEEDEY